MYKVKFTTLRTHPTAILHNSVLEINKISTKSAKTETAGLDTVVGGKMNEKVEHIRRRHPRQREPLKSDLGFV